MSATREGGLKAAATIKKRYGSDFYKGIGRLGGQKSRGGGFADDTIGEDGLTRAQRAGRKGGQVSRKKSNRTYVKVAAEAAQQKQEHKSWRERIGLK